MTEFIGIFAIPVVGVLIGILTYWFVRAVDGMFTGDDQ